MPSFSVWLRRSLGCVSVLLTTAPAALSQKAFLSPGYVVLAATPGDTLRGEVDLSRADRAVPRVWFRAGTEAARAFGLQELQAAGDASGLRYRRCLVPRGDANVPALLQVLVAGPASLYTDPTGKLPALYYLDKPGLAPMPLKREQFAQVLQTSFADCPTANTHVANMGQYQYSGTDLRRYVVNYNRCVSPKAPVLVRAAVATAPNSRVRWSAQAGAARMEFYYPYLTQRRAVAGPLTPTFGASAWLPLNRHLDFTAGLTLSNLRSQNTLSQPLRATPFTQTMSYQTQGSLVRLPVGLRFALRDPRARWRPYAQVGGHISYIVRGRMYWQNEYSGSGTTAPPQSQSYELYYGGIGRGVQAETGLLLRFGKRHLGASVRYEQTYGFPNTGRTFSIDMNQTSFTLSYVH